MSTGPKQVQKNGWGGKREGAGPKKQTLSAFQVQQMLDKAKEYADKHGKTIDDILLTFIYDDESSMKDRAACIKLWKEYTIAKLSEGGDADQNLGPGVYLPNERPDPAKVVPIKTG